MKIKLLDNEDCLRATEYVLELNRKKKIYSEGTHRFSDNNKYTKNLYSDPLFKELALKVQPKLEEFCGEKLYPTYTFTRLYVPGYTMFPHLDRHSCEFSSSLTIGYGGRTYPWELYIEDDDGNEVEYLLEPGEGLIYKGREYHHWRYPMDKGWQVQTFVHYIIVDGEIYSSIKEQLKPDFSIPFQDFTFNGKNKVWMSQGH